MPELNDQIVIVTGGAQGIGKGIARYLLGEGAGVVIADIDREAGRECVSEFKNPKNLFLKISNSTGSSWPGLLVI